MRRMNNLVQHGRAASIAWMRVRVVARGGDKQVNSTHVSRVVARQRRWDGKAGALRRSSASWRAPAHAQRTCEQMSGAITNISRAALHLMFSTLCLLLVAAAKRHRRKQSVAAGWRVKISEAETQQNRKRKRKYQKIGENSA